MALERIASVAERFLSRRSFDLIVAPAIADLAFEGERVSRLGGAIALVSAFAGAAYEDLTYDISNTLTFLGLALIPGCYYAFLFMLCAPAGLDTLEFDRSVLTFVVGFLLISSSSAVICYWPERLPPRNTTEVQ